MNDGTWRSRIEAVEKERDENAKARDDALEKLQEWRSKAKGLEQRVSEFERSLENARKQLNETLQREVEVSAALEGMRAQRDAASESAKREISQCLLMEQERDEQRQRAEQEVTRLNEHAGMANRDADAQRQRAERAEADNEALVSLLKRMAGGHETADACLWCGNVPPIHKDRCPVDLMLEEAHPGAALLEELQTLRAKHIQAEADRHAVHEALMWAGEWPLNMPPPSRAITALLEEHRKALVRARNEGLEKAAKKMEGMTARNLGPTVLARIVRAMKEPEQ